MARLVIGRGTSEEKVCPLSEDVTRIGRSLGNELVLDDRAVSRQHAEIFRKDGAYVLRDLQSRGGTHVSGRGRVSETLLRPGDRIRLGTTDLVFEQDDPAAGMTIASLPEAEAGSEGLDESSIAIRIPIPEDPLAPQLAGRRAEMLTKVAEALQWVTNVDEVLHTLLDVVFDLFQPDRGVILLKEAATGRLAPRVARPAGDGVVISRTIVEYALAQRMSLVIPRVAGDDRFSGAQSVLEQSIQAAICCPLICRGRDLGTLYVDKQVNLFRFGEEDLALFNLVAANAAIAIDNALLLEEARSAARLGRDEPGRVIATSAAMQTFRARLEQIRPEAGPLLIAGEAGAGKLFAAKLVHRDRHDADAPFVALDCLELAGADFSTKLLGTGNGTGRDGGILARGGERGALELAGGGTLVLEHVEALDPSSQELLVDLISPADGAVPRRPHIHLIATTREAPKALAEGERLHPDLARLLLANVLEVPPLRTRKEDIVSLAAYFLSRTGSSGSEAERRLGTSAETALRRLQYRHRNVAELRQAIELSAVVSGGARIGAEHLFTGPKYWERRAEHDLAGSRLVRALVHGRAGGILRILVLVLFAGIVTACLAAASGVAGRVANGLIWGLWWPGLLALFLLVGRVWCNVCPISQAGRLTKLLFRARRKSPPWMTRYTGPAMALLFLAIIWSERVFHMPAAPAATGVFLLTLVAFSAVLCAIYEREVWCRYLCPLGALSAGYAVPSPVLVHANPTVCGSQCQTHDCSKGSDKGSACPVFLHPLYVRDAHFCKLCFACLRLCRHGSAKLYVRPPLVEIWKRAELSATLIPFATVTFFVALVMLASQKNAWGTAGTLGFTAVSLVAVGAGISLNRLLPRLLALGDNQGPLARVAFSLLVAAWGPLMAFHLENIPVLGALAVHAAATSVHGGPLPALDISLLGTLQLLVIVLSILPAFVSIGRIRRQAAAGGEEGNGAWGWRGLNALCAAYACAAAVLILGSWRTP